MDTVLDNLDVFADGLWVTVQLALLSFAGAFLIGIVVAGFRVSPVPPLRAAGAFYVETVRNTPLVLIMFLFFFGLTKVAIQYSGFVTGVICLSLYTGAYLSETIRSGINSVSRGQAEAARSVGLTFLQVLGIVVLPQALRTVVQPIGNLFAANAKNTAIVYTIGVTDLTGTADRIGVQAAESIATLFAAGIGYLLILLPAGLLFGVVERRVAIKR
ncbi:amino acid ABC transporter permease [soil metagenome]